MSSLAALSGRADDTGFRRDPRFAAGGAGAAPPPSPLPEPAELPPDPLEQAFADGYAQGAREAAEAARAEAEAEAAARAALDLSFIRLDAEMAEELRQRLQQTVLALCEATLVPFAADPEILAARAERAVAMLSRAEDERVIRLHPDDLALVAPRLPRDWKVLPDPALARGSLRVETATGGVEDGPAQWRTALLEALDAC